MALSSITIFLTALVAYIWLTRGFVSALIHFLCTLIAGAIAFALWEACGMIFIDAGTDSATVDGAGWGLALAIPFAVSLVALRFLTNKIIKSNVIVHDMVNYVGGGLLGLGSGVIASGILAISLSYMRVDFVGASSFGFAPTGSVVREGGLWVPVDTITVKFYEHLSERAFGVAHPLAKWRPNSHQMGNAARMSPFDGKGRNTFASKDFEVKSRFIVGDPTGRGRLADLLADGWNENTQQIQDPDKNPYPPNSYIEGFVITFKSTAREKDGKVAIGGAQIMLVSENDDEERDISFPIAVTSQADPATPGTARFRFDAANVFIASAGSSSEATMAFEFPVKPGFRPVALYVKGIRHDVMGEALDEGQPPSPTAQPAATFTSWLDRDSGLDRLGLGSHVPFVSAKAPRMSSTPRPSGTTPDIGADGAEKIQGTGAGRNARYPNVEVSLAIPYYSLQDGQTQLLELRKRDGKRGPEVVSGELKATVREAKMWGNVTEQQLRINTFQAVDDRVMVKVEVDKNSKVTILGKSIDLANNLNPPVLIDSTGERYEAVGFVYEDETLYHLRFDPGNPIRSMSQLPALSRSRPAQRMTLIFHVSLGRTVKAFGIGNKVLYTFDGDGIPCVDRQGTGR